jgi:hypothetical protein
MTLMLGRRDYSRLIERLRPTGACSGDLQDMRLQSGARNVARQSRQVGRQAQTVQASLSNCSDFDIVHRLCRQGQALHDVARPVGRLRHTEGKPCRRPSHAAGGLLGLFIRRVRRQFRGRTP